MGLWGLELHFGLVALDVYPAVKVCFGEDVFDFAHKNVVDEEKDLKIVFKKIEPKLIHFANFLLTFEWFVTQ